MANGDVQQDGRGGSTWPWIAGFVVVAAILWVALEAFDSDEPGDTDREEVITPGPGLEPDLTEREPVGSAGDVPPAVRAYVAFVEQQPGTRGAQEYTATGLARLAAALDAIVEREGGGDPHVEALRDTLFERADRVRQDPQAPPPARGVREACTAAADVMARLQQERFPELSSDVSDVALAAQAIEPGRALPDQQEEVHRFFAEAAQALEHIAQRAADVAQR